MTYTEMADLLPGELAGPWRALLRPCARLRTATGKEPVAGVLGGVPALPDGVPTPPGPLAAAVRCAALGLADFPDTGSLLFFLPGDDWEMSDARVLYVPGEVDVDDPEAVLTAAIDDSAPELELPASREALLGSREEWPSPRETPAALRPFRRAYTAHRTYIGHQVGGHAVPLQEAVQYDLVAEDAHAEDGEGWGGPEFEAAAAEWAFLAQFEADEWVAYWLIRRADLAGRRFERARLVMQA
ncbi:hypothetical protein Afil01_08000 [Actinorhabdospora filicis]|uniref:DUF1963 domain-containing protein n=1 Tax=Actinorhabdospora filicis TaxID=1785913 RepID=A0A9W6SGR0_9ACTN|nr:DUF1963 domain-containing protein [Actinorhabdospora filicis]GLZ75993.1 hypothetical protein Afil01_08000 [Actinorhabdospora filicis]